MHTCPHCGRENNSSKPPCPACQANLASTQDNKYKEQTIIEPEVVRNNYNNEQWSKAQDSSSFRMWTFKQYNGSAGNDSCLPAFVTLGIALSLGFNYGILASIGFLVFYAIGSAMGFFVMMRRMVQGQMLSPWLLRVVIWFICALLTVTLAS